VQRVDEHPLDEAQGYAALIELQLDTYPIVEAIQKMVAEVTGESAAPAINGKADLSPRCFCKKVATGELLVCRVYLSGLPV
jgi:hypothetical protein